MLKPIASCVCFVLVSSILCVAAPPEIPPQETIQLLENTTGLVAKMHGDQVIALYGAPFAERDQEPTTDAFVAAFLAENADALGVDDLVLVPRKFCTGRPRKLCGDDNDCDVGETCSNKINTRNDKYAVYMYTQQIEGLQVHGSDCLYIPRA
jgi:hypothetical protein